MAEIIGTPLDDILNGTGENDVIDGGDGNDTITGGGGNDTIDGGDGNDQINGGAGDDQISDGAGNDDIRGAGGNDTIFVGLGDDVARGNGGDDTIYGLAGDNDIRGGSGNDTLVDFSGSGTLRGGNGDDNVVAYGTTLVEDPADGFDFEFNGLYFNVGGVINTELRGGSGNDRLFVLEAADGSDIRMIGGTGADEFDLTAIDTDKDVTYRIADYEAGETILIADPIPGLNFSSNNVDDLQFVSIVGNDVVVSLDSGFELIFEDWADQDITQIVFQDVL